MTCKELEYYLNAYGNQIYSFCRYLTGKEREAEDLYQEVFLKAMELGSLSNNGISSNNPKGYFLSIAVNIWRNRKKKYALRRKTAIISSYETGEGTEDILDNETPSPEYALLTKERESAVHKALRELPEKYRSVALLYYMEEQSTEEISKILGIPSGTVKSRLYHARKKLAGELKEWADDYSRKPC